MSDELTSKPRNAKCETCGENPCVCNNENESSKAPKQKPRVKGSHRTGNPPDVKWL